MPTNKFREMILYVAARSAGHRRFGAVKLNKILFVADFSAHRELGASISGEEYRHLQMGPAPTDLPRVRDELIQEGALRMETRGRAQVLVNLREPNMDDFTRAEIRLIDEAIGQLRHMTAEEVSEWSHKWPGWLYTLEGKPIPYETAHLPLETGRPPAPVDDATAAWARSLLEA